VRGLRGGAVRAPAPSTVCWFAGFWVVLPALAWNGWGGSPGGWPGLGLLALAYLVAYVGVNAALTLFMREVWRARRGGSGP
jgi:hypothetical protein